MQPYVEFGKDSVDKIWLPHQKQVEFIEIPDTIFEAMYGGAAGGGKSELLLMLPIVRRWHENSRFKGIIFRRTFPQLEESLIPRSHEFYKPLGATYNDTKHVWTFPSGATIRFSYLDKDKDARDHDTAEFNYVAFDELTAFTEFMYRYLTSRIRTSVGDLPAIVRTATNPGNEGHVWVRDRFVAPAPEGGTLIFDELAQSHRLFIQAKLTDNPFLMETDPNYINRLNILPEAERRAKIDGDWWIFAGQVFTEWREQRLRDEPPNACHVVPDFTPPLWWPRVVAIDWGYTAKTWVGWAAIAPDARAFLYKEYVAVKTDISVWSADIVRWSSDEREAIRQWIIDPSAEQRRGQKTIKQQVEDALGIGERLHLADNDRISGKMLMHEFLRWKPRPPRYIPKDGFRDEIASRILRISGQEAYEQYCGLFLPEPPESNLPRLQVCRRCRDFIKTLPSCVYKQKDGENTEDVAEFNGDDSYDGGRYLVKAVDRYIKEAAEADVAFQKRAVIHNDLKETGDWTRFHRRMEHLEATDKGQATGVWRGRNRGGHFNATR